MWTLIFLLTTMTVYLGFGSNLGDRRKSIEKAKKLLEEKGIKVCRTSPIYESEAICRPGETMPDFLNGVFEVETELEPEPLLKLLKQIESEMGREPNGSWRPRPIDLDILFYGDRIIDSEKLKVPHPDVEKRWFVIKPLVDLVPDLVHPGVRKKVSQL